MAKLVPPINTTECHCGIHLREEEMISDHFQNADYLLCPQCELAIYVFTANVDDETQKPIITKEIMVQNGASEILHKIRKLQRAKHG